MQERQTDGNTRGGGSGAQCGVIMIHLHLHQSSASNACQCPVSDVNMPEHELALLNYTVYTLYQVLVVYYMYLL